MTRWTRRLFGIIILSFAFMAAAAPAVAQAAAPAEPNTVEVTIIQEDKSVQPGRSFWVALQVEIPPDHHAYWKNPGDTGMPLSIEWQLPEGWKAGPLLWPVPETFTADTNVGHGYEGTATFLAEITPSETLHPGTHEIGAHVTWLICSSSECLPGQSEVRLALAAVKEKPVPNARHEVLFAKARTTLPQEGHPVAAERLKGTIRLQMNEKEISALVESDIVFYPEKPGTPAPKKGEIGIEHDAATGLTVVVFPDGLLNEESGSLDGILAFSDHKNGVRKAWEIHTPITASSSSGADLLLKGDEQEFQGGLGLALVLAFAGGMLLNLMPCVLPVLSFKVMGFMQMSGQSRSLTLKHGLVFSLGVLLSFWTLAGVMLGLQAYGSSVGWGFQLQDPLFVAVLAGTLFVFSLSLFGVYELGTSVASVAGQTEVSKADSSKGFTGSFLSGVLATAIATPCTGPFLGTAVGFAFTLAAPLAMLVFTSLGFGMAFPYLILSAFPRLLKFMPKPGSWMVIFKEVMGFLLLATVLWLVWVFGTQTSLIAVASLLFAFLCFAIGCWVYGKFTTPISKKLSRMLAYVVTAFFFVFGTYVAYTSTTQEAAAEETMHLSGDWIPYSPEKLQELRAQGKPVFIDFTAEWCLSCKANHLVLTSTAVSEKFRQAGIVKMVADWTKRDPKVTEALRQYKRNSIPLYVLYGTDKDQPPQILPQVLTPDIVMKSIDQLSSQMAAAQQTSHDTPLD